MTVSSGLANYPREEVLNEALKATTPNVYRIPALSMAKELGNARAVNVVVLGALSALLPVVPRIWKTVLKERVPVKYAELNLEAFQRGREWLQERSKAA